MAHPAERHQALPTPFYDDPWKPAEREAAHAFWAWHKALWQVEPGVLPLGEAEGALREAAAMAEEARPIGLIPKPVTEAAYGACAQHQLPPALLAGQVRGLRHLIPPVRFASYTELKAFIHAFAVPHTRLLARLAGADRSWQQPQIQALAEAFFLVRSLTALKADLERDRLFIPEQDCDRAGVGVERLRRGRVDERVKKLLWKQSVRARDAFAQSLPLAGELERRYARAFKRWWHGGLEVLNEIERRAYDVWTSPVTLGPRYRMLVRLQARFGRATFKK